MFRARTYTDVPTKHIPLIVREDAFPHELHLQRRCRLLSGDHTTHTRSRQQLFGAVSLLVKLHGSGPSSEQLLLNFCNAWTHALLWLNILGGGVKSNGCKQFFYESLGM